MRMGSSEYSSFPATRQSCVLIRAGTRLSSVSSALASRHILDGTDHLLFVICLLIPFRRIRPLIVIVTSFTVAHSLTLIASAFGMVPNFLWFPPLIETLIALSIVYMAFENIVGTQWQKRWMIAFGFGLVHGFGFSFALSETLQFAGGHLLTSCSHSTSAWKLVSWRLSVLAVPILNFPVQERDCRAHGYDFAIGNPGA